METNEMLQLTANARVMEELAADGINVALPLDACEIDMIACVDSRNEPQSMDFVPIHIVVLRENETFGKLDTAGRLNVLTALVWKRGKEAAMRSFALTSAELVLLKTIDVIDRPALMSTKTAATPARMSALSDAIEAFAMSPGRWRKKLRAIIADKSATRPGATVN
jgi:hypothetical protein